ncbi:Cys-tRNA(Pro) deacylase, prolyl-tRNA editing enzyme YbaK/EbsC [Chryseobacterium taichungense]|uniref:Cys-tRNA(Pro) deacylase, prolyl-tRNA editing enzyme YbaK/EbsC n=1 Tax=Chryseobacterium taichungense TaxID=295069 RepID=A0A1H7XEC3_9FLAO|nr:YbaK/EbsC family protein [Chryseobacterium taichungense]SEM32081.1 Cys-tRNA(Pro) deacylase, prolyl-tRNA editing enzyme YbaK/EbsC [Chryseobacterium taichungense]
MSIETAKEHLSKWKKDNDITILDQSSATVELAAKALGVIGSEIAKSVSFYDKSGGVILIVASGTARIDGRKFKDEFGLKAKMLSSEDVELLVGHPVGGVCPFGVKQGVNVYLDDSLKHFEWVYPACGSGNSAIKLSIAELEQSSEYVRWVNVTKE